jgi:uncharacterized protein YciI
MLTEDRTPEEARILSEHFDYLERLTANGVVHLAGRTLTPDYAGFGFIVFSAESEDAARQVVRDDPAVQYRVRRAELYPFRASLLGKFPPQED